ncbi:MAG: nucleotide exchange factor GrpE [Candidatus Aegiribacteria sp.]|nr:nucleotide exchange factor GrpE [Candidatus Aegiribacteria sp.]
MADPRRTAKHRGTRTSTSRRVPADAAPDNDEEIIPAPEIAESDENIETEAEEIEGELSELEEKSELEKEQLRERILRLQAEFDNYRKRQIREFKRLCAQGKKELIEELLAVLDNYSRAEQLLDEGDHPLKEIAEGLIRTSGQLTDILRQEGLHSLDVKVNDTFDPNYHEAMLAEEVADLDRDIILEVFQKGYMLGDELLRPARVKVGKPIEHSSVSDNG